MTPLDCWESFYRIVGPSAGVLIGLQFVVMTLLADIPSARSEEQAGQAFGTPNVVHFGVVLLLSAMLSAPWNGIVVMAILWGLVGFAGAVYVVLVTRRMRSQHTYQAVFEDWLFHVLLPLAGYIMLALSAPLACWYARPALFVLGTAELLLLFIGIHNAWDTVMYHVFVRKHEQREIEHDL